MGAHTASHTSNTSKREKERGERGRNCKHACNSARANQNVMSLRSVDDEGGEGGGRLGPSAAGGGDLRAGKKRCHKSCYSTPSSERRGTAEQSQIKSLRARRCLNDPGRVGSVRSCRPGECAQVASPGPNFASKARWDNTEH